MTKKLAVTVAVIVLLAGFILLVLHGARRARGVPVPIEEPHRIVLKVPYIDAGIDLAGGISSEAWDSAGVVEVPLMHQVMVAPWGNTLVPAVTVQAFHNRKDFYVSLSWPDDTEDREAGMSRFPDAAAIMYPMKDDVQPSTLMMGFTATVNIWQWKADQDAARWLDLDPPQEPYVDFYFEEEELLAVARRVTPGAVNDLMAVRVGTVTAKETQRVEGRGVMDGKRWRVVFQRSLEVAAPDVDARLSPGSSRLCALAIWNGAEGDTGGRKSISDWVELEIER